MDGVSVGVSNLANTDFDLAQSFFRIANVGWSNGEQWAGVMHGVAISDAYLEPDEFVLNPSGGQPRLQAGDADQDLDFDQLDLVQVQIANKYLSGQTATWGEGDWDGAPGWFGRSSTARQRLFRPVGHHRRTIVGRLLDGAVRRRTAGWTTKRRSDGVRSFGRRWRFECGRSDPCARTIVVVSVGNRTCHGAGPFWAFYPRVDLNENELPQ